jgi:hypothetical protein
VRIIQEVQTMGELADSEDKNFFCEQLSCEMIVSDDVEGASCAISGL